MSIPHSTVNGISHGIKDAFQGGINQVRGHISPMAEDSVELTHSGHRQPGFLGKLGDVLSCMWESIKRFFSDIRPKPELTPEEMQQKAVESIGKHLDICVSGNGTPFIQKLKGELPTSELEKLRKAVDPTSTGTLDSWLNDNAEEIHKVFANMTIIPHLPSSEARQFLIAMLQERESQLSSKEEKLRFREGVSKLSSALEAPEFATGMSAEDAQTISAIQEHLPIFKQELAELCNTGKRLDGLDEKLGNWIKQFDQVPELTDEEVDSLRKLKTLVQSSKRESLKTASENEKTGIQEHLDTLGYKPKEGLSPNFDFQKEASKLELIKEHIDSLDIEAEDKETYKKLVQKAIDNNSSQEGKVKGLTQLIGEDELTQFKPLFTNNKQHQSVRLFMEARLEKKLAEEVNPSNSEKEALRKRHNKAFHLFLKHFEHSALLNKSIIDESIHTGKLELERLRKLQREFKEEPSLFSWAGIKGSLPPTAAQMGLPILLSPFIGRSAAEFFASASSSALSGQRGAAVRNTATQMLVNRGVAKVLPGKGWFSTITSFLVSPMLANTAHNWLSRFETIQNIDDQISVGVQRLWGFITNSGKRQS
jgi:hypothetical protein